MSKLITWVLANPEISICIWATIMGLIALLHSRSYELFQFLKDRWSRLPKSKDKDFV
jgi:hypothetical protein